MFKASVSGSNDRKKTFVTKPQMKWYEIVGDKMLIIGKDGFSNNSQKS